MSNPYLLLAEWLRFSEENLAEEWWAAPDRVEGERLLGLQSRTRECLTPGEDRLELAIAAYQLWQQKAKEHPDPTAAQRGAITGRWHRFVRASHAAGYDPDKLAAVLGRQMEAI